MSWIWFYDRNTDTLNIFWFKLAWGGYGGRYDMTYDMRLADLNTDALHHMQLAGAVKVQNWLKLAGRPGIYDSNHNDDDEGYEWIK